jgi:hypothetical protein
MIKQIVQFTGVIVFACIPATIFAAEPSGLVSVPSNNSVGDTIQRFEDAVKASGWMVSLDWITQLRQRSINRSCWRER